jgi:hypothetical protein
MRCALGTLLEKMSDDDITAQGDRLSVSDGFLPSVPCFCFWRFIYSSRCDDVCLQHNFSILPPHRSSSFMDLPSMSSVAKAALSTTAIH